MKTAAAAKEFLSHRRFAVTGVSRHPHGHGSNAVYQRLRERGYEVFAVNLSGEPVEGDPSYPNLAAIPGVVDVVVIATRPDQALGTVKEAEELGITRIWMHRSVDAGSVSEDAVAFGRSHGMVVIDGGCPLMYGPTSDFGHKTMCAMLKLTGRVPRTV